MGMQFDLELARYALTAMSKGFGSGKIISDMLRMTGQHFGLEYIALIEKNKNMTSCSVMYEFCGEGVEPRRNHIINLNAEQWEQDAHYFECGDMLFYSSAEKICQKSMTALRHSEDHSMCIGMVRRHGKNEAGLIFETAENNHNFTEEEKSAFEMLRLQIEEYLFMMMDMEREHEELTRIKMYDSVTGLMKYDGFITMTEGMYKHDRNNGKYALMYADISNFKYVNDYYGYAAGDDVLRRLEQFFMVNSPTAIVACRLFSDYFLLFTRISEDFSEQNLVSLVERLSNRFSRELREVYPDAKINVVSGISIINDKSLGVQTYINRANIARKRCKQLLTDRCMIFNEEMEIQDRQEMDISTKAEEALNRGEFYFVLQPKINLLTGETIGAEALVRWKKEDGTMNYPDKFIPVFEKSGFITKLDFMVYTEVCRYLYRRLMHGEKVVPISMNVSRVNFERKDFIEEVIKLVDDYKIPHQYLEFEITENVFLSQKEHAQKAINKLRDAGFAVSMDDFGSGYSSLNLLKELDFDVLKLDKEFLSNGMIQTKDAVIISNVIRMAKQMNIKVLCEGVETKEQAEFLAEADCNLVQGYYYGKPMMVDDFESMLTVRKLKTKIG